MNYTYETAGNHSYLVARAEGGRGIINYQLQMLTKNDIKNILKAVKRQSNDDIMISYNITSRITLSQVLVREQLSKSSLINLIISALDAIDDLYEYRLPSGGLLLEPDRIYLKPGTDDFQFVYIPDAMNESGIDDLRLLISDLIMKGKIEKTGDDFIQVLLDELNSQTFSVDSLRKMCAKVSRANEAKNRIIDYSPQRPERTEESAIRGGYESPTPPAHNEPRVEIPDRKPSIPEIPADKAKNPVQSPAPTAKKVKKQPSVKNIMIICTVILCLIAACAMYLLKVDLLTTGGVVLCIAAVMILIIRKMSEKQSAANTDSGLQSAQAADDRSVKVEIPPISGAEAIRRNEDTAKKGPGIQETRYAEPPRPEPPRMPKSVYKTDNYISNIESDETEVFIPEEGSREACLEYSLNGVQQRITLSIGSTVIGKLSTQCDVAVEDPKVSKVHAEFINRDGKFFVRDCNSKNGTYINGSLQRIQSNVEYQINFGDCISLADLKMTLRLR